MTSTHDVTDDDLSELGDHLFELQSLMQPELRSASFDPMRRLNRFHLRNESTLGLDLDTEDLSDPNHSLAL